MSTLIKIFNIFFPYSIGCICSTCNIFPHPNRHSPAGWGGHDAENCVGVQAEWIGSDCPGDPLSGHVVVPGGRSQKSEVNTHLTILSDTVTHFQMNLLTESSLKVGLSLISKAVKSISGSRLPLWFMPCLLTSLAVHVGPPHRCDEWAGLWPLMPDEEDEVNLLS